MDNSGTPTNSSHMFGPTSLYGKSAELHTSLLSRESEPKDLADIDAKLISIGGSSKQLHMAALEAQNLTL